MFSARPASSLKPSGAFCPAALGAPLRATRFGASRRRHVQGRPSRTVRAVISRNDKGVETASPQVKPAGPTAPLAPPPGQAIEVRAVVTISKKIKEKLTEKILEQWDSFIHGIGQGISIQLVSEEVDPGTKSGKRSTEAAVRGWLPRPSDYPYIVEYTAEFTVPPDFGRPGAILVTNVHHREVFLREITLHGFGHGPVFFPANTWIHSQADNPSKRIIFSNQAYLPSRTPDGLADLRREDLASLRGDGRGERKKHEMIYDYAPYNDLGAPDKSEDLARPVLAGEERPYPRRCRTGRPATKSDPLAESVVEKLHPVYVPRDEAFEEIKDATFSAGNVKMVLHNVLPLMAAVLSRSDDHFGCFSEIDNLYKEGIDLNSEGLEAARKLFLPGILKNLMNIRDPLKYDVPSIISRDKFSWLQDNQFACLTLAGMNPVSIERVKEFPITSKLDPAIYGPPESAITAEIIEHELQGLTVEQAIEQNKLFILDFHDILLPFVERMNNLKDRKAYASRTVFAKTSAGTLRPIAIELSLPSASKKVYARGHDATTDWLWRLAKAHVCSNDTGVHQLVTHWLRTHACMEPYIIAAHRQLSSMHPVFKLLHPHMRYTMEINALARQSLINAGGIIEEGFSPGKYSLEISSAAYKSMWRFDMEGLPADLIRRGMAVEDPAMPGGVRLVIEDYPYAADGLLIWSAIREWVHDYVAHFYPHPGGVSSDAELRAWWDEIRTEGHADKRDEPWWPELETGEDLESILATIIWTASGQHAAVNFGQYPLGGYMPNRPALMKRLMPEEEDDAAAYERFLEDPQRAFLSSLPTQLKATQIMAVQETLSTHSPDEEYLGQLPESHANWIGDRKIVECFEKFSARLEEIEKIIKKRNRDKRLKNRTGAGMPPYELLLRSSGAGATGRGIPNSISI